MCKIFHLRNNVIHAEKKTLEYPCAEFRVISAQNHLRPGNHPKQWHRCPALDCSVLRTVIQANQMLILYNNSTGKINKAYKFGPAIKFYLFIYNSYTLSSNMSRTTRGIGKSRDIIMLTRPCNGDPQTPLFYIRKTGVNRGSCNQFVSYFCSKT